MSRSLLRLARIVALVCAALVSAPATASAADGNIGQTSGTPDSHSTCFGGNVCTYIPIGAIVGRAPADGTLTSFSFNYGTGGSGTLDARLLVWDDSASTREPTKVRQSEAMAFIPENDGGTQTFDLSAAPLRIDQGEIIGLSLAGPEGAQVPEMVMSSPSSSAYAAACAGEYGDGQPYDCAYTTMSGTTVPLWAYFYSAIRPPEIDGLGPSPIGATSATLRALIDANEAETTAFFRYGTSSASTSLSSDSGTNTPLKSAGSGPDPALFSHGVTGLLPETVYYYRAYAENETDQTQGPLQSFRTAYAAPPVVAADEAPQELGATSATVGGSVNPNGRPTEVRLEYGTDPALEGATTEGIGTLNGSAAEPVAKALTGLAQATRHYWRIVVEQSHWDGEVTTVASPIRSFVTYAPPGASADTPIDVGEDAATLRGAVVAHGVDTTWRFEYGKTAELGASTGTDAVGSANGDTPVAVAKRLTDLEPDTTYHWRLVAESAGGSAQTAIGTFRTLAGKAPGLSNFAVKDVTATTATLAFDVDPHGYDTTFYTEFGPTPDYGTRLPASGSSNARGPQGAHANLGSLAPGTTYHWRIVATNRWGTTVGPDQTLTTLPLPTVVCDPTVREVTTTSALLRGAVTGGPVPVTEWFEYGLTTAYGRSSATLDLPAGATHAVQFRPLDLAPGTVYHWRIVARSAAGVVACPDQTFVTPPAGEVPIDHSLVIGAFDTVVVIIQRPIRQLIVVETSFGKTFTKLTGDGRTTRSEQARLQRSIATYLKRIDAALRALKKKQVRSSSLQLVVRDEVKRLTRMRSSLRGLRTAIKRRSAARFRKAMRGYLRAKARRSKLVTAVDRTATEAKGRPVFARKAPKVDFNSPQAKALVGRWRGSMDDVVITLAGDGTYTSTKGPGTWRPTSDGVQLTGAITHNGGRAKVKGGVMEFYWRGGNGSINYFAYVKQ